MVPSDLIGVLLFLASPDSDFMTGQMVNVDLAPRELLIAGYSPTAL
jgi:hypothetical protein